VTIDQRQEPRISAFSSLSIFRSGSGDRGEPMLSSHLSCRPKNCEEALVEAEGLCVQRRVNLTPVRRLVLAMLLESGRPTRAYDILPRLRSDRTAKPPTLYRALDFLIEAGLVHRVESLNAYVPCGHWGHVHSAVLLICDGCGICTELHAEKCMLRLVQDAGSVAFAMRTAVIEARGLCQNCQ
jgi:Fur family zinc uptake transcriptional regulator